MDEPIQFIQENPIPFLFYFLWLYFIVRGFSTPKEKDNERKEGEEEEDRKVSGTTDKTINKGKLSGKK